jgi:hypothetical protein
MPEITLYQQARRDGGRRSGIEIGNEAAFSHFEQGNPDTDPALVWYIDVRCSGPTLPQEREAARDWLLRHAEPIARLVRDAANVVPLGYDPTEWPLQVTGAIDGVDVTVASSAVRRSEARRLAEVLGAFADHLQELIRSLSARPAA